MRARETFRVSMAYLHTWLGLVLGFILMAVFFFGSLSVFDREIDRWSIPETRGQAAPLPAFDARVLPLFQTVKPDPESVKFAQGEVIGQLPPPETLKASDWFVGTNHRDPLISLFVSYDVPNKPKDPSVDHVHVDGQALLNPHTGERVADDVAERLHLGSEFFFPLHYGLHLTWKDLGIWIVGLSAMAMLAALISGVVMHRRIFREFFTFRPEKQALRSTLDLHNMTGVLALPFLFVITFSGLLIFASLYLPSVHQLMHPLEERLEAAEAVRKSLPEDPAGVPAPLASIDAMIGAAKARWAQRGVPGEVGFVDIIHVGDANGYVSIWRDSVDRVATAEVLHFQASTGKLVYEEPPAHPVDQVEGFLTGLHFQQFKHWGLRWLLFAGGLMGCACIATGFLFFVEKRKKKHAAAASGGARIVDALAVTAVTGMLVATGAIFVANRALPTTTPGYNTWQQVIFWLVWLATLGHALIRSGPVGKGGVSKAWAEQCLLAAVLAACAAVANWATTGDHLVKTIGERYWPVAGVDLVLLAGAAAAAVTGLHLSRRAPRDV